MRRSAAVVMTLAVATVTAIAVGGVTFALASGNSDDSDARPRQNGQDGRITETQQRNVALVRRALEWDPGAFAEDFVWHFQGPDPLHFEGRDAALNDWLRIRDDVTGGTFKMRTEDIWPVGDHVVVAHVEVDMTINDDRRQGSSAVVYRLKDGVIVEGFDITSPSLFG